MMISATFSHEDKCITLHISFQKQSQNSEILLISLDFYPTLETKRGLIVHMQKCHVAVD